MLAAEHFAYCTYRSGIGSEGRKIPDTLKTNVLQGEHGVHQQALVGVARSGRAGRSMTAKTPKQTLETEAKHTRSTSPLHVFTQRNWQAKARVGSPEAMAEHARIREM